MLKSEGVHSVAGLRSSYFNLVAKIQTESFILRILEAVIQCGRQADLVDLLWKHFESLGFQAFACMAPSQEAPLKMVVDWRGYPENFVETYKKEKLYRIDPFPAHVTRNKSTLRISEIAQKTKLSRAETDYIARMKAFGITDGYIIPTFGMDHRILKFSIGQVADIAAFTKINLLEATAILQMAHRRLEEIAREDKPIRPRLPRREVEILHWIARGKTNAEIAVILGVAAPTIATHIGRMFDKLDVNDRASLAVKGFKHGIICV